MALPQASIASSGEVSPEPPGPLVGKESLGRQAMPFPSSTVEFLQRCLPHGYCRESIGFNHWESDLDGKVEEELATTSTWMDLGKWSSYHRYYPSSNPNQWFCLPAEPSQSTLWSGNSAGSRLTWFRSFNKDFYHPDNSVGPCSSEKLNHSPSCCWECFLTPSDQKGWWQLLEAVQPVRLQVRDRWSGNNPQAKSVMIMEAFCAMFRQEINS